MIRLGVGVGATMARGRGPVSGAPTISIAAGSGYAGSTYTSTVAGQWTADGAPISGATGTSHVMTLANEGKAIRCGESNTIQMWVPQLVAGLVALMDARRGLTLSGASVSAWASQVGGVGGAQATGASQPVYGAAAFGGAPGLTFDGGDSLDGLNISPMPVSRTVLFAANMNHNAQYGSVLIGAGTAGGYLIREMAGKLTITQSSVGDLAQSASHNNLEDAISATRLTTGSQYSFRRNGVSSGAGVPAAGTFYGSGPMRIGANSNGAARLVGVLSSFLVWDLSLEDADVQRAEGWMAHTLSRQDLLPVSHPYKTNAPQGG